MRARLITAIALTSSAVALASTALAPAATAKNYMPGDNPMCAKYGDTAGNTWTTCMEASATTVKVGQPVTFTTTRSVFDPGTEVCLARGREPWGAYQGLAACTTVNKDGSATITAYLGKRGASWYDIGTAACLAKAPADRSPKKCGDNGGVQSTPLKVKVR